MSDPTTDLHAGDTIAVLAQSNELLELVNAQTDRKRPDLLRRFDIGGTVTSPLRISAQVRTEGVTGPPGQDCTIFFNIEFDQGPIFWDAFLYPDTGSTPWRTLSCDLRSRGVLRNVELHVRFHAKGRLLMRGLRIESIAPWPDDAQCTIAIFGDSTDMTCYLPTEHRMARRLEMLLRDRFADHRIDVHCLAEGGEYLQRMIDTGRLERELRVLPRCDIAMFRFGINDEPKKIDPRAFGEQLQKACDLVHARYPNAKVVFSTTIPPFAPAFNEQARSVAAARGLHLIELEQFIRDRSAAGDWDWHHQPGSLIGRHRDVVPASNPTGLDGDGHPNAYGAQFIAEHYFEHLEPMVAAVLGAGD